MRGLEREGAGTGAGTGCGGVTDRVSGSFIIAGIFLGNSSSSSSSSSSSNLYKFKLIEQLRITLTN
jgi:hypothetical protein